MANITTRTPEKEQAIIDALELHPSKSRACRVARVHRRRFYDWVKADPDFKTRVEAAQQIGIDAVEDALFADAMDHDTTAAIFTLKSWRPQRYRESQDLYLSGKDGGPLQFAGIVVPLPVRPDDEPEPEALDASVQAVSERAMRAAR